MSERSDAIVRALGERPTRPAESAADIIAKGRQAIRAHARSQAVRDAYVVWHAVATKGRCRACVNEAEQLLGL